MADDAPDFLHTPDGARLAYCRSEGRAPTVVFLSGFASHMGGTKALHLQRWCEARGQAFLRLDYQGHGRSSGEFEEGSVGVWAGDALAVIEAVTQGPVVLVGSSMGAWIMLLVARRIEDRVQGLVGLASAPDFTEELIHDQLSADEKAQLHSRGRVVRTSDYDQGPNVFTIAMLEDGRRNLVLNEVIALECPVRLIHGMRDDDVPWSISLRLSERLESEDVQLTLVKSGKHRLSEPGELDLITGTVGELLDTLAAR